MKVMADCPNLPVLEIFPSIQGEGTMMGQSVVFVRLAGCNLRCPWCDTKNSWNAQAPEVKWLSPAVIKAMCGYEKTVVITGGEPCMYPQLDSLVNHLSKEGCYVCIETNGTLPTPLNVDWVVASPKPPHYALHPECRFDELKYVVSEELDFVKHVEPVLDEVDVPVWLQPEGGNIAASAKRAYDYIMGGSYNAKAASQIRLGIQLHKILDFR